MTKEKTFRDYLNAIPKQSLTNLFYGVDNKKIVSLSQVTTEINKKFFETKYLEQLLKGFSKDAHGIFVFMIMEGESGADIPAIRSHFRGLSEEKINEELKGFQSHLLVFGVKTTPVRYYVFKEIREHLKPHIIEEGRRTIHLKEYKEIKSNGDSLLRDVTLFLLFLLREPLRRTKNGGLNRKQLDVIIKSFENKMDFNATGETWPSLFKLMHGFMHKKEFLDERNEEWRISEKGVRFLDMDVSEQAKGFYQYIIKEFKEEKMRMAMAMMKDFDKAASADDMIRYFHSKSEHDDRPLPEIFEWLFYCGLMDLADGNHQHSGFILSNRGREILDKKSLSGESSDKVTILPTFEIIAPRMLKSGLLKYLFMGCVLEKSDALLTFKITRESLIAGLNRGFESSDFLKRLIAMASHQIPQNIIYSIEEWLSSYGAVAFEMHFLLRVKKPELFDKIKGIFANTRYITEELPGTGFSINASDYQEVFSILTRLGYSPKPFAGPRNAGDVMKTPDILESYLELKGEEGGADTEFVFPDGNDDSAIIPRNKGQGKYSGKLHSLPFNELVHVINYAILMERGVETEMKDSGTRVRMQPGELRLHLSEPVVAGSHPLNGEPLEIKINDIEKIRVED